MPNSVLTMCRLSVASDPEMGRAILEGFEGWIDLVENALRQALRDQAIAGAIPSRQVAYSIAALFLGIELMTRLDPQKSEADAVFDSLRDLAVIIESMPAIVGRFIKPGRE